MAHRCDFRHVGDRDRGGVLGGQEEHLASLVVSRGEERSHGERVPEARVRNDEYDPEGRGAPLVAVGAQEEGVELLVERPDAGCPGPVARQFVDHDDDRGGVRRELRANMVSFLGPRLGEEVSEVGEGRAPGDAPLGLDRALSDRGSN